MPGVETEIENSGLLLVRAGYREEAQAPTSVYMLCC